MNAPRRSRAHALSSLGIGAETEETFELAPHEHDGSTPLPVPTTAGAVPANLAGFDSLTRGERIWMLASVTTVLALCALGVYLST